MRIRALLAPARSSTSRARQLLVATDFESMASRAREMCAIPPLHCCFEDFLSGDDIRRGCWLIAWRWWLLRAWARRVSICEAFCSCDWLWRVVAEKWAAGFGLNASFACGFDSVAAKLEEAASTAGLYLSNIGHFEDAVDAGDSKRRVEARKSATITNRILAMDCLTLAARPLGPGGCRIQDLVVKSLVLRSCAHSAWLRRMLGFNSWTHKLLLMRCTDNDHLKHHLNYKMNFPSR